MKTISEEMIEGLTVSDFRELTTEEKREDDFKRMFQLMGLIYKNQIELMKMLDKKPA